MEQYFGGSLLRRAPSLPSRPYGPSASSARLQADLQLALQRRQLEMHFQPQVSLASGEIVGAEALMRWRHPQWGMIPPAVFIPMAEQGDLIDPMGNWAIATACSQLSSWRGKGIKVPRVSVNLSMCQLQNRSLVHQVRQCLARYDLAPEVLDLELTENAAMASGGAAIETVRNLKALGVRISLDDFGTGYSSLSLLQRLPVDQLKIDKAFVNAVTTNRSDAAICRAVITLAHALGMSVVVEGIETYAQMQHLRNERCDDMQGHYFSWALNAGDFESLVRARRRLALH